jgi:hypothetical protein
MGLSNLAARRGAKANRRKAIVAQKRKVEAAEGTLAGQVAGAVALPIRDCLLTENLLEVGIGTMILVRGSRVGPAVIGMFLLDPFCRGIKDTVVRTVEGERLDLLLDTVRQATPLVPVDPSYARKLLGDLALWSTSLGFPPHRGFATVERLFGDVDARACETSFEFGENGKPLYMSGPMDPPSLSRRHLQQMRERFGADGFHYIVPA